MKATNFHLPLYKFLRNYVPLCWRIKLDDTIQSLSIVLQSSICFIPVQKRVFLSLERVVDICDDCQHKCGECEEEACPSNHIRPPEPSLDNILTTIDDYHVLLDLPILSVKLSTWDENNNVIIWNEETIYLYVAYRSWQMDQLSSL